MTHKSPPPSPSFTETTDPAVLRATAKAMCEQDHLFFSRYFFKHHQAIKFRVNWHHELIAEKVQAVIEGQIQNLVINVLPVSSKTELVAINLMARGLALNPRARFLHISYSDDLALLNSQTAKELVQSEEFQELWPLKVAADAKSKKRWNIEVNGRKAGGVYAVSLGGQITGFRAGHTADGWQGAIVIDDPLKVGDAYSKPRRAKANRDLIATVKSRRANPDTPIIVIMQRPAQEDVDHVLFLSVLVVVLEKRIVVGVDGEHRITLLRLSGGVPVAIPQACDAQRCAVGSGKAGGHRDARPPVGFEDGLGRDDALLAAAPGIAEGEGLGRRLASRIESGELPGLV